jgi:hypothetical protein
MTAVESMQVLADDDTLESNNITDGRFLVVMVTKVIRIAVCLMTMFLLRDWYLPLYSQHRDSYLCVAIRKGCASPCQHYFSGQIRSRANSGGISQLVRVQSIAVFRWFEFQA